MTPRPPIHWRVFAAAVLILLACAAVLGVRRFWPRLEPARSLPRTPWDRIVFDGQCRAGAPVSYRLATGRWQQEATLPEEDLSRFVAHGRELWIPGADARGS